MGILPGSGPLGSGPTGPGSGFSVMPRETEVFLTLLFVAIDKYLIAVVAKLMMMKNYCKRETNCSFRLH